MIKIRAISLLFMVLIVTQACSKIGEIAKDHSEWQKLPEETVKPSEVLPTGWRRVQIGNTGCTIAMPTEPKMIQPPGNSGEVPQTFYGSQDGAVAYLISVADVDLSSEARLYAFSSGVEEGFTESAKQQNLNIQKTPQKRIHQGELNGRQEVINIGINDKRCVLRMLGSKQHGYAMLCIGSAKDLDQRVESYFNSLEIK